MKKFFRILLNKTKKYDKKAHNPFLKADYSYNPFRSIWDQTYIWIEKPDP